MAEKEPQRLVLPRELAKRSLAWVLDDTRGFHVSTLDDDVREELLTRLFWAVLQLEPALESTLTRERREGTERA